MIYTYLFEKGSFTQIFFLIKYYCNLELIIETLEI